MTCYGCCNCNIYMNNYFYLKLEIYDKDFHYHVRICLHIRVVSSLCKVMFNHKIKIWLVAYPTIILNDS